MYPFGRFVRVFPQTALYWLTQMDRQRVWNTKKGFQGTATKHLGVFVFYLMSEGCAESPSERKVCALEEPPLRAETRRASFENWQQSQRRIRKAKLVNKAKHMIILSAHQTRMIKNISETISPECVVCFRQQSAKLSPLRHILWIIRILLMVSKSIGPFVFAQSEKMFRVMFSQENRWRVENRSQHLFRILRR